MLRKIATWEEDRSRVGSLPVPYIEIGTSQITNPKFLVVLSQNMCIHGVVGGTGEDVGSESGAELSPHGKDPEIGAGAEGGGPRSRVGWREKVMLIIYETLQERHAVTNFTCMIQGRPFPRYADPSKGYFPTEY